MRVERENSLPKITIFIRAQIRKNNTSVFVMKQITHKPQLTFCSFCPLSTSTALRKLVLLHNLSRINTHDKFTLEDAVITEMIGSKLRFFSKVEMRDIGV